MRRQVVTVLRPLDAISVENSAYPGTPDVNFVDGWVELKWLRNWPKCETAIVAISHFTPQQRVWLLRRARAGGNVWLLLQCKREWLLFDAQTAARVVGRSSVNELVRWAHTYWPSGLKKDELLSILDNGSEPV